jgi:ATP adenylyltransferase
VDLLWAPWRMRYIKAEKTEGCIFCTKPTAGDDAAAHIVWRGGNAFVLLNAYPYNNGHLMVAPYAHVGALEELPFETAAEMMALCQDAIMALRRDFDPDGFNVGLNLGVAAGAGIKDHVHVHVVPRWSGDTNFMPVTGDVRVIPQSLDHAYELLRDAFAELKA